MGTDVTAVTKGQAKSEVKHKQHETTYRYYSPRVCRMKTVSRFTVNKKAQNFRSLCVSRFTVNKKAQNNGGLAENRLL